jgi:hypothetical protein
MLRSEGFAQATTVEDFLRNAEKRSGLRNAVVICDEAGLKSNRQGGELLRLADKYEMRVLLVGDVRQARLGRSRRLSAGPRSAQQTRSLPSRGDSSADSR